MQVWRAYGPILGSSALRWIKKPRVQRHLRLVSRLLQMPAAEIRHRLQLKVQKLYRERSRRSPPTSSPRVKDQFEQQLVGHGPDLQKHVRALFDERFFFGPSHQQDMTSRLWADFPAHAARTIALADDICDADIGILGHRFRLAPARTDWQADPLSGRRAWPEGYLDEAGAIGVPGVDVKYVWEVNRHQFLPVLGRAFWLTGNGRYVRQSVHLIDDWIAHNAPGQVNWCSHLEVGMRSISWLWTMPYVLAWPGLDSGFLQRWLVCLAAHHEHLARNLSVFTDPTNHLIGEATALWMLSVCLPDLPDAAGQAQRTWQLLLDELSRQVTPDGVSREQASSYHRFVLDFYIQFILLCRRNARALPQGAQRRVEAMVEFAAALAGSTGEAPMIGDSDDARGLPLLELVGRDFRDVLSTGGMLFGRPDWLSQGGAPAEATFWLLGGASQPQRGQPLPGPSASRIFPDGGYCFLRLNRPDGEAELIFDVGPLGLLPNAAHGHADALSVILRLNGREVLTDPGTGTYFSDVRVRDALRRTPAHNTASVDHVDQADILDTFKWVNPMHGSLREYSLGAHFDYVVGTHDGYARLRHPVVHERTVLSVKTWGWIVIDRLFGRGEHLVTRHFNLVPGVRLTRVDSSTISAIDPGLELGILLSFPPSETEHHPVRVDYEAPWSIRYGDVRPAPRIELESHMRHEAVLFTFIVPLFASASWQPSACTYSIEPIAHAGAVLCRREAPRGAVDLLVINPLRRVLRLQGDAQTDAGFLFLRTIDGTLEGAFLGGGGEYLGADGKTLKADSESGFASFVDDKN
jgi:hypothetical protein